MAVSVRKELEAPVTCECYRLNYVKGRRIDTILGSVVLSREVGASDVHIDNVLLLERHRVLAVGAHELVELVRSVRHVTVGCLLLLHHLQGVFESCARDVDTLVLCSTVECNCNFGSLMCAPTVSLYSRARRMPEHSSRRGSAGWAD